jgi:two-component system response regulator DesR
MTSPDIRVLLVDDNAVYRSTLALLLDGRDGVAIVAEASDGPEAVAAAVRFRPDVVLLDFRLPGASGDEVAASLVAGSPGTRVVCLTAEATPDERQRVIAAGAAAVVEKGGSTQAILDAIRSA